MKTTPWIEKENQYVAHNYHPLPVVLAKALGSMVWDIEDKPYFDFLSAYSAVNQGHSHPRLLKVMEDQMRKLTLTSRAFHSDTLLKYAEYITHFFGYDKVLPMNTGAEGVETALKIARRWGYQKKDIPQGKAKIIVFQNNFHGRTLGAISASNDREATQDFGPFLEGFVSLPYNDAEALKNALDQGSLADESAAVLIEPIQGEAGIFVPDEGFLSAVSNLCQKHNILFIADEIQTGLARTGKMLAMDYEDLHPDMLILGKALSGGMYPISAVLAANSVMDVLTPGSHGSTYGGNPMANRIAIEALQILKDEKLDDQAYHMGKRFREILQDKLGTHPKIRAIRGKGLLNALEIDDTPTGNTAWNLCLQLKENGLLAKPTHGNIIRLAPPLVITETEMDQALDIIIQTVQKFL